MIRKGDRVRNLKTGETGVATSDITYRTTSGRSYKQIRVQWDDQGEWDVLIRNIQKI